jgi:hypothetical protein
VQAKLSIFLLLVIASTLLAGCAGTGQPDAGGTALANASKDLYAAEFNAGFVHHASASSLFNNATSFWDDDDYSAASSLLEQARAEYALAEDHYHNMSAYAGDDTDRAFVIAMEESAIDMHEASSLYMKSIEEAMAGNDTASLEYFQEGQGFVDLSMIALNESLDYMPSYLG